MLVIRLSRVGKKNQPEYRLIINEKTKDPWGDALEYLGYFNPRTEPPTIDFNEERIKYWLAQGAQVSDTVKNLFIEQGLLKGDKARPGGVAKKKKADSKEDEKTGGASAPTKEEQQKEDSEKPASTDEQAAPAEENKKDDKDKKEAAE
jgi:small subunit ribosomal protein S16